MPLTARTTDKTTAHSPCAPGQCSAGSHNVFINNLPAFRVTDKDTPHGFILCVPHVTPLSEGSPNVFVNNLPLGRLGDAFSCGIKVASGSPNVITNG